MARVEPDTAPTVTAIAPPQAYNYRAVPVTITGTGFVAAPTVTLNQVALTDVVVVSDTTITATVPGGLLPGPYTLTVTNPGGASASLPDGFTALQSHTGALGPWRDLPLPPCSLITWRLRQRVRVLPGGR